MVSTLTAHTTRTRCRRRRSFRTARHACLGPQHEPVRLCHGSMCTDSGWGLFGSRRCVRQALSGFETTRRAHSESRHASGDDHPARRLERDGRCATCDHPVNQLPMALRSRPAGMCLQHHPGDSCDGVDKVQTPAPLTDLDSQHPGGGPAKCDRPHTPHPGLDMCLCPAEAAWTPAGPCRAAFSSAAWGAPQPCEPCPHPPVSQDSMSAGHPWTTLALAQCESGADPG